MRKVLYITAALLFVAACTQETNVVLNEEGEIQTLTVVGPAPIQFEPITGSLSTKGTSVQDGNALLFNWAVGDTLGIFPNQGNQVEFPISVANGTTSASFDGGGWALRNNASYAAYYPFSVWNYHRDNETILLDYSGQVQDGNGSFAHLSAYDYLASSKTTPMNSSVTFQMERQGSILYIDIVVPEPETITALEVSCDEAIFTEKAALDISGNTPVVTPVEMTKTLRLEFVNTATTSNNETVRGYLAVQPVDFSAKTVKATLYTATGSYEAPVTSRVVNKGRAAFLRFSDDFTPVNIEFADAEVKRICVEHWDTNGDGELSYKEAAAVTDLGDAFRASLKHPNVIITSFNELQYFKGLSTICDMAFQYFNSLSSIILPEGITRIGEDVLMGCSCLTSVIIPDSITSIGIGSFRKCSGLTSVAIPDGVTLIGSYAFNDCTSLTSIVIPDSVSNISVSFNGCSSLSLFQGKFASEDGKCLINNDGRLIAFAPYNLTTYTIPDNVTRVGRNVFYGCSCLTSVIIPNSVSFIEENSFRSCSSLSLFQGKFASEDGKCLINNDGRLIAFAPYNLTSYTIPDNVTTIGAGAFFDCSGLTSIVIPDSVTTIGSSAFHGCSNLSSIVIPDSVSTIASYAFHGCSNLSSIVIPDSVSTIASYAFYGCSNLSSIVIPDSVTTIGSLAFYECSSLTSITIESPNPFSIDSHAFSNTNNCPIYVPNQSVEAYKTASGWSKYADRIFGIDVDGSVVGPDPQNPD